MNKSTNWSTGWHAKTQKLKGTSYLMILAVVWKITGPVTVSEIDLNYTISPGG